nr:hypothetical protein [Cressdnaviricota sp.]
MKIIHNQTIIHSTHTTTIFQMSINFKTERKKCKGLQDSDFFSFKLQQLSNYEVYYY